MHNMDKRAWTAGFMAGGIFAEQCPYMQGSFEALDWYGGWIEGAATALDRRHYAQTQTSPDRNEVEIASPAQGHAFHATRH